MISNKIFFPFSSRDAVGSSNIRILALREKAFAMLINFFSAKVSCLIFLPAGISIPNSWSNSLAAWVQSDSLTKPILLVGRLNK